MTIREHSNQFMATLGSLRPNSTQILSDSLRFFNQLCGDREPQTLEVADLRRFIECLRERGNNNSTIKLRLQMVRRMFTWLADEGIIPDTTLYAFTRRRLPALPRVANAKRPITRAEHERLLRVIRTAGRPWWRTSCIVAWHTGLRLSDVAHLTWAQIDWTEETIAVTPIKTQRIGKTVTIPMEPELVEHLLALRAEPYYDSPDVLSDMKAYYGVKCALEDQFRSLLKRAGIVGVSFHSYRHAFVSRLANSGINPKIIATMTGQTVEQIMSYTHVTVEAKRAALEQARRELHTARLAEAGIVRPVAYVPVS